MAGQQEIIYNNYVKSFDHIVKPEILTEWPQLAEGETMEKTDWTRKWGESYRTQVYKTSNGRIIEVETISWYKTLFAVFENHNDWFNFRRPMGMFHYLNT